MRYSRQERLLGKTAQKKLQNAKVVIVGVGALGSVAAEQLVRAGVQVVLIDRDIVELHNLQRQTLFTENDVGKPKAVAALEHLHHINSDVLIQAHTVDLDTNTIDLLNADLILDGTDNMYTRQLINEYARKHGIPWIYAGAIETHGTVAFFDKKACFRCLYQQTDGLDTCDRVGILNTASASIANLQVSLAIKYLVGEEVPSKLFTYNLWTQEFHRLAITKKKDCPVCSGKFSLLDQPPKKAVALCGKGMYQLYHTFDLQKLQKKLKKFVLTSTPNYASFKDGDVEFSAFVNRLLIKASSAKKAKSIADRYVGS